MTAPTTTSAPGARPVVAAARPALGGDGSVGADAHRADRRRQAGLAACLISATGFGALPVLGKAAYDNGLGPLALLWGRFGLTAIAFWLLVAFVVRPARPPARLLVAGLLMGALGYAVEAGLFFVALERVDASLVELLLYAYPAIVTAVALAAGREAPAPRLLAALALATLGVIGVFAGSLASGVDPAGLALGLAAAAVYAGYVLAGERVVDKVHPVLLAALVATGATAAFTVAGLVHGGLPHPRTAGAWESVAIIAAVATVIPMAGLFAGIERVGAPTASIVSTFEPVVTVVLAGLFLGESLSLVEAIGAACVIAAVRLLARRPNDELRPGVGQGPHAPEEPGVGAPGGAAKPPEAS
ncbi:MAG TPA: DMT family transporter [Acidimicrobiia bacterium]|nr:DMT family transporter [Acidimicrobiia bacterium]HMC80825.1 DMT family transporter [Acidimicrobiia bacterium]